MAPAERTSNGLGRQPKVYLPVESSRPARGTEVPPGPALADQAQVPRPGDGLGAVGRAQLAQDVADVLFDREDGDEQLPGDGPVRRARGEHRQHLQLTA